MPREPFLINPPKRKNASKRKSGRHSLPKSFAGKKMSRISVYKTGKGSYSRSPFSPSKMAGIAINPYGEEVVIVGANPRRRRKRSTSKRHRTYRGNPVSMRTFGKRRNLARRYKRRAVSKRRAYRRNPVARRRSFRSRLRRNPAMVGTINFQKPMSLLMPIGVGIASLIATKKVPALLNLSGNMKYVGQVGVGIVGAMLLKKPLGSQNAMIFGVVSLVTTATEVLADKVGGIFSGLDAYVDYETGGYLPPSGSVMGDFVDESQFGAFVSEEDGNPFA